MSKLITGYAEELHKKLGGDEFVDELKKIAQKCNRAQRESIVKCFDELYPEEGGLKKIIEEQVPENIKQTAKHAFQSRAETGADKIANAFGSFSVEEEPIYEMLFNYPKWLKDEIKQKFQEKTGEDLLEKMQENFTNPVKKYLEQFLDNDRDFSDKEPDKKKCEDFVKFLTDEDPMSWIRNEDIMNGLAELTPREMLLAARLYKKESGKGILDSLEESSASPKKFLTDLLYYVTCPPAKYANLISEALKDENKDAIMDIIQSRGDVDMPLIGKFYEKMFGNSLAKDLAPLLGKDPKEYGWA
ncbi:MAG: hypothetical protein MJ252_13185 [archaeon]|nr:hypothetical protein [archaeon]